MSTIRVATITARHDGPPTPPSLWLEAIQHSPFALEAVCTLGSMELASAACQRFGGRWPFDAIEPLLRDAAIDLAIVDVPPEDRVPLTRTLARERIGVHLVATPGRTQGEFNTLSRLAEKHGFVGAAWPLRFTPAMQRLRQLRDAATIGPTVSLVAQVAVPLEGDLDPAEPLPWDAIAEVLDAIAVIAPPAVEVIARATPAGILSATLIGEDGETTTLHACRVERPEDARLRIDARGVNGETITLEDAASLAVNTIEGPVLQHTPRWLAGSSRRVELGHQALLNEAVAGLRRKADSPVAVARWQDRWRTLDALRRSVGTGRSIAVDRR